MQRPAIPPTEAPGAADADVRADAYELFMVEAGRVRLLERVGPARVVLRSGVTLNGELMPADGEAVRDLLCIVATDGRRMHFAAGAVTALIGASPALREEGAPRGAPSLGARLREAWASRGRARVLLRDARWIEGSIALVAADHLELISSGERWVVPFAAVDAWDLGEAS